MPLNLCPSGMQPLVHARMCECMVCRCVEEKLGRGGPTGEWGDTSGHQAVTGTHLPLCIMRVYGGCKLKPKP